MYYNIKYYKHRKKHVFGLTGLILGGDCSNLKPQYYHSYSRIYFCLNPVVSYLRPYKKIT
jgi:hypothetical protein